MGSSKNKRVSRPAQAPAGAGRLLQTPADTAAAVLAIVYIALICVFPVRSNDVWWNMAVGREMLSSFRFITQDPFTFTMTGSPWVPHSYLSGIVFYLVHLTGGVSGLIALRVILVAGMCGLLMRLVKNAGVPLAWAVPFLLVGMLSIHSRFLIRPHLFEYVFLVILMAWLLGNKEQTGWRYYLPPALMQIAWVNTHSSFYIAPVIVLIFWLGESLSRLAGGSMIIPEANRKRSRRLLTLAGVLSVASLVNPDPGQYILQPLGGEQRELLTRYTLEWLSPFHPALKHGAHHPYYEIFLVIAAAGLLAALVRRRFATVLLVGLFAALSLKAHRFRSELVVISLPLLMIELRDTRLVTGWLEALSTRFGNIAVRAVIALVLGAVLILTAADRIMLKGGVGGRHPERVLEFIQAEDVAHRMYHPIGYGSLMVWKLYPDRRSFIDGRNFSSSLYQDFLACQTNVAGFNRVIGKYDLDSFLLPVPQRSDAGITNLHTALHRFDDWSLVYIDAVALLYVRNDAVPAAWLDRHAYRHYHPAFFGSGRISAEQVPLLTADIERAINGAGDSARLWYDLARIKLVTGDRAAARQAVRRSLELYPRDPAAIELEKRLP